MKSGLGLTGWVARNRRTLVNARPSADLEAAGISGTTSLQSALVCPLVFNERFIGTLSVYHIDAGCYTDDHRRLLDRVCEQAAAVIYNSIVFEQTQEDSLTDPLTGLPNTRFMFMHLTRELARAERLKSEVSLLVMDLDHFKEINDNHGHHVGDRALREVAGVLRAAIRPVRHLRPLRGRRVHRRAVGLRRGRGRAEAGRAADGDRRRGLRGAAGQAPAAGHQHRRGRSSRTTATRTRRCWRPPTAGCTATRRSASARWTSEPGAEPMPSSRREPSRRRSATRELERAASGVL